MTEVRSRRDVGCSSLRSFLNVLAIGSDCHHSQMNDVCGGQSSTKDGASQVRDLKEAVVMFRVQVPSVGLTACTLHHCIIQ